MKRLFPSLDLIPRVVSLAKRLGLTQADASKLLGIHPTTFHNWQCGRCKNPKPLIHEAVLLRLQELELAADSGHHLREALETAHERAARILFEAHQQARDAVRAYVVSAMQSCGKGAQRAYPALLALLKVQAERLQAPDDASRYALSVVDDILKTCSAPEVPPIDSPLAKFVALSDPLGSPKELDDYQEYLEALDELPEPDEEFKPVADPGLSHFKWKRIRDLPLDEQEPFKAFLKKEGRESPVMFGVPDEEQDAYWEKDYGAWHSSAEYKVRCLQPMLRRSSPSEPTV